jgi:hypothetical protein
VGTILSLSIWRWIGLAIGLGSKELHEHAPVWLEVEVLALEKASGFFGWIWAILLLLVAVLRHLAGEAPLLSAKASLAHIGNGTETGEQVRAEAGRAWAEKEEQRFQRPRCC